jgi:hypothetical protein
MMTTAHATTAINHQATAATAKLIKRNTHTPRQICAQKPKLDTNTKSKLKQNKTKNKTTEP